MIQKSNKAISTTIALVGMIALLIIGFGIGYVLNPGTTETPTKTNGDKYPEDSAWRTGSINFVVQQTHSQLLFYIHQKSMLHFFVSIVFIEFF